MNTQEIMAWALVGLLVCNVLTLVAIGISVKAILNLVGKIQSESGPALQKARESLAKIETLTESTEKVIRESVTPTLAHFQETTHAVSESAAGVRRMVGRVEDAVAKPIALVSAASSVLDTPTGKAGLLALGMSVARFAFRTHALDKSKQNGVPKVGRKSNGLVPH